MTYHPLPNTPRGDDNNGFMLGLIAGAAVGGGLALLFAPRQGTEIRQGLASGAQQAGRRVTQAYGSLAGTARRNVRRVVDARRAAGGGSAPTTGESGTFDTLHEDRARPAGDVISDAIGEATYTPAPTPPSTPATSEGPGLTSPAPDDSRSPLV